MAEKSFGVKEINLIGASGTPTIESPNNLNLNAVNVAISTNVSVGGTVTISGDMGVNHINAVGIVTAGEGIFLPDNKTLHFGNTVGSADGTIHSDGSNFLIQGTNASQTYLRGSTINIAVNGGSGSYANSIVCDESPSSRVQLCYNGGQKLVTTNTGVDVTGAITVGGSALSIDPSTSDIQGMWTISGGTSGYTFTGPGQNGSDQNPDIFLVRGQRYRFVNNLGSGHPFEFRNFDNDADYTDGITGSQSGTQDFNVQHDAPSALKYRCTIHTNTMLGNIYIIGGRRGVIASSFQPSGSAASFTNQIPEWATKITILLHRVSFTGTDNMKIRLRDNISTYSSGYYSYTANATASYTNTATDSFLIGMTSASQESSGKIEIEKVGNLYWTETHLITTGNNNMRHGAGQLTMSSGTVSSIMIQSAAGDNYDGNSRISVYFE